VHNVVQGITLQETVQMSLIVGVVEGLVIMLELARTSLIVVIAENLAITFKHAQRYEGVAYVVDTVMTLVIVQ
jgi:hypothetical protein